MKHQPNLQSFIPPFLAFSTVLFFSLLFFCYHSQDPTPVWDIHTLYLLLPTMTGCTFSHFLFQLQKKTTRVRGRVRGKSREHIVRKITWKGQKCVYGKQTAKVKLRLFLFLLVVSVVSKAKHPAPLQPTKSNYCTSQAHISQFSTLLK